jgi:hypothetical protein
MVLYTVPVVYEKYEDKVDAFWGESYSRTKEVLRHFR